VKKHAPPISIVRARNLRRNATEAERRMWALLREHFGHVRYRRQVPLRHYICDFVSHGFRLVIEIDGGQHTAEADCVRTRAIEAEGYRIVRFWNSEVLGNPEWCATQLSELLRQAHPHPATTRQQAAKSSHHWPSAGFASPIKGEGI